MTPDCSDLGFAPYRKGGPPHAWTNDQTWCGLPGTVPDHAVAEPEDQICRNCARALRRGRPWRVDGRLRVYIVYSPSRRSPHVSLTPPGRGWKEDRESSWRYRVLACSKRQALYLAANRIEAAGPGEVGIVEILEPDPSAWEV